MKKFIFSFLLLFILFLGSTGVSALSIEKKETFISPIDFGINRDILPVLPVEGIGVKPCIST